MRASKYCKWTYPKVATLKIRIAGFLAVMLVFFTCNLSNYRSQRSTSHSQKLNPVVSLHQSRLLLWTSMFGENPGPLSTIKNNSVNGSRSNLCSSPSIKEFPQDLFSVNQLRHGAVVLHIIVSIYMFIALAFVCDDYFVASLDSICENLNLSDDIAGATFMAAGSSAPELFTSFIGLFITHGDVGTGTIVGSAVFNILVILALVSLGSGEIVTLTWWPLCRDSFSYCVATVALIGVMYNGHIEWYESIILLLLYAGYLMVMKFNGQIRGVFPGSDIESKDIFPSQCPEVEDHPPEMNVSYHYGSPESYELVPRKFRKLSWKDVGMMIMLSRHFSPATRFRAACYMVTLRQEDEMSRLIENDPADIECKVDDQPNGETTLDERKESVADVEMEVGPFEDANDSMIAALFQFITRPVVYLLQFTVLDCKKTKWKKWYMVTFVMSIFWIAIFSYVMVWMVTVIGFTLDIPDVIMGIVFLAAGTSVPDAIASLIVSRQGQGDMAVSNSIGSNVFDILIGLAFPWFIQTSIMHPGSKVTVNSRGLKYSVILLLGTVIITVLTIFLNKWKLDKRTGITFLLVYVLFVSISCLIEFNVFGFVNIPVCKFSW